MTKQEAIKELYDIADQMPSMECKEWIEALGLAIKSLENQKTGHWIEIDMDMYECSECHKGLSVYEKENYCSHCGAKMEK